MAVRGWPDYVRTTGLVENYDEFAQNYPIGIGDGAARLGSIKTYDMRGRVYWFDDFEASILKWPTYSGGVGGSQGLSTLRARNGNQSVEFISATGAGANSYMHHWTALPREVTIGAEIHISLANDFGQAYFTVRLYDGVNRCTASICIDEAANQVQYLNEFGVYQNTGFNPGLTGATEHFHAIKMVWDYNTDEWLRVMYDHQELNLNRETMQNPGWAVPPAAQILVGNSGDGINNVPIYVDDFIFTTMEPE